MILIDGKKIAAELREELKKEVFELKSKYNKVPGLTVILIGEDAPSQIYVRNKEKSANEVGLKSEVIKYPDSVEEKTVLNKIEELNKDESISIEDNGRGIPVDKHPVKKKPAVEVILTTLHAGGKFDSKTYAVSGGLHGVGVTVVNFLSEYLEVEICRDGAKWHQRYEIGKVVTKLKSIGKSKSTGTKIIFKPDKEIFKPVINTNGKYDFEPKFDYQYLSNRLRELAFLNSGLKILIHDERSDQGETFYYKGGLVSYVEHLNSGKKNN